MKVLDGKGILTTGQAAAVCRVAPRTISKWCDAGLIPHYRIPTSQDRRIYADGLVMFMAKAGMRVPPELASLSRPSCVVAGMPDHEYRRLEHELTAEGWRASHARTWPEAMLRIHHAPPLLFVATPEMGRSDCWNWADTVKVSSAEGGRLVYVMGDDETEAYLFKRRGYEVIQRPVTASTLGVSDHATTA